MSAKSKQHENWICGITITHPNINKGNPLVLDVPALEREYNSDGTVKVHFSKLPQEQQDQQVIHYSIVQMFSDFTSNYWLESLKGIKTVVLPALQRNFNESSLKVDNLSFRRFKVDSEKNIVQGNGTYNPESGEWSNVWLTWQQVESMINFRKDNPELLESRVKGAKVEKEEKEEEQVKSYSFLNTNFVLSGASAEANKAVKESKKK